jgi:hypothetical protein
VIDSFSIKNELEIIPKQAKELQETPFFWCGFKWVPNFQNTNQFPTYYYTKMNNLYMKLCGNQLYVSNSLHKMYKGNNYESFTYKEVCEAFELLNNVLPINIYTSKIIKISFGIVIKEDAQKVLNEWQYYLGKVYLPMKHKNKTYGAKYFLTDYQIKGYDKTFEVKNHNQINLNENFFRFEIDNCRPRILNNKTNNIGVIEVSDIVDKVKFEKIGKMVLYKYNKIEKKPKLDITTLSLKQLRVYAEMNDYEVKEAIKKRHTNTYKKDRTEYGKIIRNLKKSTFQDEVIAKLKQQISYSLND